MHMIWICDCLEGASIKLAYRTENANSNPCWGVNVDIFPSLCIWWNEDNYVGAKRGEDLVPSAIPVAAAGRKRSL